MANSDKELIFHCSENGRVKIKELSSKLGKSSQRLKYNLETLERDRIIYNPYTLIDYSLFGLLLFRVYFKGCFMSEKEKNNVFKKLEEYTSVIAIYELEGEFDLVIEMEAPNPSRFNKELKNIITEIPILNNYKIVLNIVTHIYPRNYLLKDDMEELSGKRLSKDIIVGGDRKIGKFDKNELKIIKSILLKPKIRLTDLAQETGLNIKTVASTLRNLEKRTIIKGYKYIINTDKLGINKYRLFLKLRNLSKEKEIELGNYLVKTPEIIQMNKTVGDWDMEIDLEALNKNKIRGLILNLREAFIDIIEDFNSMEFYEYSKKTFLPLYIFEEEN